MVRLDWDIDADTGKNQRIHLEDQTERKRRWRSILRFLLVLSVLLGLIAMGILLVSERLQQVDSRLEQVLADTVAAEVAALRIGDEATFMDIQWDANGEDEGMTDWLLTQQNSYNTYQTLKSSADIQLTGNITDIVLDGQRGRLFVEEINNGIPYRRAWFYWRFPEGWRHVPPDYTFWGENETIESARFELRYKTVDTEFATAVQQELITWLDTACVSFSCDTLPPLTLDIVPQPLPEMTWANNANAWQMIIPSPYIDRARADIPFETRLQLEAATLLATRMVDHTMNGIQPQPLADADYFRAATISWLVGRFAEVDKGAYLINSLAERYGENSIQALFTTLEPASDMGKLRDVTGIADLSQAGLDWRDFLTWRLNTEDELILRRDEVTWLRLID
ncbi:MAG: hypothetical protein ACPG7F_14410, partial [Aggregatilineales bacterium]